MAYYEIIMLACVVILAIAIGFVMYGKGFNFGRTVGFRDGRAVGEATGYTQGLKDGHDEFKKMERSIHLRNKQREKQEREELQEELAKVNEQVAGDPEVPIEILMAYGVTKPDQLPQEVRIAYDLKQTGGVIDGDE